MTKIIQRSRFAVLSTMVSIGIVSSVYAYTPITSQLDFGARGTDVTNLQAFFADNSVIYPEALVTGYFGGLTKAAVQRFQGQYGFDQVGRVGPLTREKINSLILSGGWTIADLSGPWIYGVNQTINKNSSTFTWSTDEMANAKVFYNTSPITMNEGDFNSVGFGSTNGYSVTNDGLARTAQQVTISNLQANTRYYYVIVSTDLRGNVSVFGPNNTFVTASN